MNLEPTSERVIEDFRHASPRAYLIYLFHIVTYDYVRELVHDMRVLDFGCGSGYGTARIAENCRSIIGVDVAADAIAHARQKHQRENLDYITIAPVERQALPFPDQSFDVVLSFQVIEHVMDEAKYLSEAWRVLRPGGYFLVATPDRSSRLLPWQKPWNRWHVREYSASQFKELLATRFSNVSIKQMGGRPHVIAIETARTKRLRWLLLPLTLPFIPEPLRVAGLGLVRAAGEGLTRWFSSAGTGGSAAKNFSFGTEHLSISDHEDPSVNLIAIATR
jgi:SAM-dependent methyltransferase